MKTKLSCVIIGFGTMGKIRYHAVQRHGGYEVKAVCDIRSEVRAGIRGYGVFILVTAILGNFHMGQQVSILKTIFLA